MSEFKITLQNRITTLLILSSVIFISVFTFIQINNQIANINRYNTYQANLSAAILANNLEATINQLEPAEIQKYVQNTLKDLKEAKLIKETVVFGKDGLIIGSTQEDQLGQQASYRDINIWDKLTGSLESGKSFIAEIDSRKKNINIYIAVRPQLHGPMEYIAKSTFAFASAQEALKAVYNPVIIAIIIVIVANIIFGYLFSKTIIGPIKLLNSVTKLIAEGDLNIRTSIKTDDELQELGSTFNYMTEQLIKMKERAENANPLTKLPGNIVIHEIIENRIKNKEKFVVIYCDIDNFKAFNDKYGIAKGDEAIKLAADLLKESIKTNGDSNDFLGHEGGDDFILVTTPKQAQKIADFVINEFDRRVRNLYSSEDLAQGFIVAHARDGSVKKFPLMTISLAGITNETRTLTSYAEVTNIAAEVKKKAKAIEGKSVFIMDRRQVDRTS